jgi:two-component system response regulator PilR (NtrC family)
MSMPNDFQILVIDDEPDLRTLYELTLLREGYHIDTAGGVADALALLGERQYSVVITDMRLPDGTGLDVLAWLEREGRREKALVITAYGSATNAVEALKAGAYDYLSKPVDLKQFRSVVASALGRGDGGGVPPPAPGSVGAASAAASAPAAGAGAGAGFASGGGQVERSRSAATPRGKAAAPAGLRKAALGTDALSRMAGDSAALGQVRSLIDKVSRSMAPVLITGESGTGKELVARSVHESSPRCAMPFLAVNCGAIPEQLLEAEFFGYRKGAFTGANEDREGFFRAADGGTLFLDEIGDLPLSMQSKLLRVIQERAVRALGATAEVGVNVRLLSATHKDLAAEVQAGRFRQDLFYRLNVIPIRVPALRDRREDLPAIAQRILTRLAHDAGMDDAPMLTAAALRKLSRYAFPGNVREFENLLHRAVALASGEAIDVEDLDLPPELLAPEPGGGQTVHSAQVADAPTGAAPQGLTAREAVGDEAGFATARVGAVESAPRPQELSATEDSVQGWPGRADGELSWPVGLALPTDLAAYLDHVERAVLLRALERYRHNRTAAGASMGLTLRQMRYRMARLGIQLGSDSDPDRFGGAGDAGDGA